MHRHVYHLFWLLLGVADFQVSQQTPLMEVTDFQVSQTPPAAARLIWRLATPTAELPPKIAAKLQQALYASGFRATLPAHAKISTPEQAKGLYHVQVGIYLFDISADGDVSIQGNVLEHTAEMQGYATEYSEPTQYHAQIIRETLEALDEERLIVFAPVGEVKHTISIFTDVSCPYSVELHREIDLLNDAGVKVRYLAYPRLGEDSLGYQKMRPVWCSDNPKQAFNRAINNQRIRLTYCDSALDSHIKLGDSLGLMGTPTLLFEDGRVSTGYSSAIDILGYLEDGTALPDASFSWVADFAVTEEDRVDLNVDSNAKEAPALPPAQLISLEHINPQAKRALRNNLDELRLKPVSWQQMQFTNEADFYSTTVGAYRFDVSHDGSFVMKMNLLENRPQMNEAQRAAIRKQALLALDKRSAITFTATQETKHTVTIFIDANCHFCMSQYRETSYLNQLGVTVRYLAYPSAGLNSLEHQLLNVAWCAKNRQEALLSMKLKERQAANTENCASPVAAHYEFGKSLGIQGTPTSVLENGHLLPGYVSADEMLEHLENNPK